jgi:aminotransferase
MAATKLRPDIRVITRLVPPSGNLVQGQSELKIDPALARAAAEIIADSQNHYGPAEGSSDLRRAVSEKIAAFNGVRLDPKGVPLELLVTSGATGGLISIAQTYLREKAALVFEPYYPYHRHILSELGGATHGLPLHGEGLRLDGEELRARCRDLVGRRSFPLRAIIACSPANPTGRVFNRAELEAIAGVCQEFDLLCIADEVYEHYVVGDEPHTSIATLPGMWERTITVNSFSKSWNISGWRLGYLYGPGSLIAPLNKANNVFYVCPPTPLQRALSQVLMADPRYYGKLRERFKVKRQMAVDALTPLGFEIYDSGSAFYVWARIPEGRGEAMELNELLMKRGGVAGVPGSAFADSDDWDHHMRLCIAREDDMLRGALEKIEAALTG